MHIQSGSRPDYSPSFGIACCRALSELVTIVEDHQEMQDPLSNNLKSWGLEMMTYYVNHQKIELMHLPEIQERIYRLTTQILVDSFSLPLKEDPVLELDLWVWERARLLHYLELAKDGHSLFDPQKKSEYKDHLFGKAMIAWVRALSNIKSNANHPTHAQLSHLPTKPAPLVSIVTQDSTPWTLSRYHEMGFLVRQSREQLELMEEICQENEAFKIDLTNKYQHDINYFKKLFENQKVTVEEKISKLKEHCEQRIEQEKEEKQKQLDHMKQDHCLLQEQAKNISENLQEAYLKVDQQSQEIKDQNGKITQMDRTVADYMDRIKVIESGNQFLSITANLLNNQMASVRMTNDVLQTSLKQEEGRSQALKAQLNNTQQALQQEKQRSRDNEKDRGKLSLEILKLSSEVRHLQASSEGGDSLCLIS